MAAAKDIAPIFAKAMDEYINKGSTENMVCADDATLTWFMAKAVDRKACGKKFKCRVSTLANDSFTGYSPYEQKKFQPTKGYHDLEFEMKEHRATAQACLQEIEYACAEGTFGSIMNELYTTMVDGARMSINRILNSGTGDSETAYGLEVLIADGYSVINDMSGASITTFGGLNRLDCPWLQSIVKRPGWSFPDYDRQKPNVPWTYRYSTLTVNAAGVVTGGPGSNIAGANLGAVVANPYTGVPVNPLVESTWWQALSLDLISSALMILRKCKGTWNGIMQMHPDLYKEMVNLLEAAGCCDIMTKDEGGVLIGGHDRFRYMGVSGYADYDVPLGTIRFLTTDGDALRMRVQPNQWMQGSSNWMEPYDQNAMYTCVQAWFQLYSCNPRMLAKLERVAHKPSV